LIEEIHGEDDAKMQNSFQAYDGCSGKSNCFLMTMQASHFCTWFSSENQVTQTNARLLPTFTNAGVTLLRQSLAKSSLAQRATPPLLVDNLFRLLSFCGGHAFFIEISLWLEVLTFRDNTLFLNKLNYVPQ
jgi:hypothetical protein